jgi:uncharacterized damage-inducible protein DinB
MLEHIRDLYTYQEWADAGLWKGLESWPDSLSDDQIRATAGHLHLVQRAFLKVFLAEPIDMTAKWTPPAIDTLKEFAREFHKDVRGYLATIPEDRLKDRVNPPWFPKDANLTFQECALQAMLHSQHHRGQLAGRLRQLGGSPVTTDYIVWVLKGKPEPKWP